jgi:hypothetical protein
MHSFFQKNIICFANATAIAVTAVAITGIGLHYQVLFDIPKL